MTVSALCSCGYLLRAEDEHGGKKARCPKCKKVVRLPIETDEAAERSPAPAVNFVAWQPATAETSSPASNSFPSFSPSAALPPPATNAVTSNPGKLDDDSDPISDVPDADAVDFRKKFFGVLVCQMVFRFAGILWIAISIILEAGMLVMMAVSVIYIASNNGLEAARSAMFLQSMAAAIFTAWCVGAFLIGCGLLAMSELLNAAGWWFYRQRIGGLGPC